MNEPDIQILSDLVHTRVELDWNQQGLWTAISQHPENWNWQGQAKTLTEIEKLVKETVTQTFGEESAIIFSHTYEAIDQAMVEEKARPWT